MTQAVERAISILEFLSSGPQHPQLVAERIDVHRTTALRLIQDLVNGGLARRNEDGTFSVGYRLAGLAQAALEQFDLRRSPTRICVSCVSELGVTVHIATVVNGSIVYADKIEPHGKVRLYSQIGKPVKIHASGVGKAVLAFMPPQKRRAVLSDFTFERFTAATIVGQEAFAAELARVRRNGYSTDDGEYESFVNCIGYPVPDAAGRVRTAISVTAIKADRNLAALRAGLPQVRRTAEAIAAELGWVR